MSTPCGWCLAGDHLIHEDGRPPCGCRCGMSAAPLVAGQNTAWRYRCDLCGFRRTGLQDEMEAIEARHWEEHVDMYDRAWAMLDDVVEEIGRARAAVVTDRGPDEHEEGLLRVHLAQERGRGASRVLAAMLQVEPATVGAEVALRARARAKGRRRRTLSAAELRGYHETPNRGGHTDDKFETKE